MKYSLRSLMIVGAPMLAGLYPLRALYLLLVIFGIILISAMGTYWAKRRSFAATLDSETIEAMKSQPLANALAPPQNATLTLPRFSIAHLMGFTFVCAVDVWSFLWDPCLGFWVTLVSQVLFWTMVRVRAVLQVDNQSQPKRRQWFWGVVIISAIASIGAVVTFLVVVLALIGIAPDLSGTALTMSLFVLFVPVGMIAAGVCLWLTWPRPSLTFKGDSLPNSSSPAANPQNP